MTDDLCSTSTSYTMETGVNFTVAAASTSPNLMFCFGNRAVPVVTIRQDGTIEWNGRVVEGDDEFKAAMLDLYRHLTQGHRGAHR